MNWDARRMQRNTETKGYSFSLFCLYDHNTLTTRKLNIKTEAKIFFANRTSFSRPKLYISNHRISSCELKISTKYDPVMTISRVILITCGILLLLSVVFNREVVLGTKNSKSQRETSGDQNFWWRFLLYAPVNFANNALGITRNNQSLCERDIQNPPLIAGPKEAPKSLHEYIRWHRHARKCFENEACTDKPKVLIWRCHVPSHPCAGLGDRLRGIVSAMYLAYSAQRVFLIDWPVSDFDHYPISRALIPTSIDWQMPDSLNSIKHELPAVFWGSIHNGSEEYLLPSGKDFNPSLENFELETADTKIFYVSTVTTELLISRLQKNLNTTKRVEDTRALSTTILVRALYKTLFRPSRVVLNLANAIYSENNVPYISVHSRTGDDVGEAKANAFVNMSSHDEVSASLLECATKVDPTMNPKIVFLAADSIQFKTTFNEKAHIYGYNVVTPKWRALHLRKRPEIMGQVSEETHCQEFLNIFADLILMSRGKALVSTGSGFARVAFYFGNSIGHFIGYDQQISGMCKLHRYIGLK